MARRPTARTRFPSLPPTPALAGLLTCSRPTHSFKKTRPLFVCFLTSKFRFFSVLGPVY